MAVLNDELIDDGKMGVLPGNGVPGMGVPGMGVPGREDGCPGRGMAVLWRKSLAARDGCPNDDLDDDGKMGVLLGMGAPGWVFPDGKWLCASSCAKAVALVCS